MSEFVTSKRREYYLAHTSCPLGESVKQELLVAPGPDNLWLIQPLLSSTASLLSIFTAVSRVRSGSSGDGGYASPLDFSRPALRVIVKNPVAIGGCLSLHWQVWSDEGAEPWVVEVWR